MHWDIVFTDIVLRRGESFGIAASLYDDDAVVDLKDVDIDMFVYMGSGGLIRMSTNPNSGYERVLRKNINRECAFINFTPEDTGLFPVGSTITTITATGSAGGAPINIQDNMATFQIIDSNIKALL